MFIHKINASLKQNLIQEDIMVKPNIIDKEERRHAFYDLDNSRQQELLAIVDQYKGKMSDQEQTLYALHAINAARAEIDWLQRTGHNFVGQIGKYFD